MLGLEIDLSYSSLLLYLSILVLSSFCILLYMIPLADKVHTEIDQISIGMTSGEIFR